MRMNEGFLVDEVLQMALVVLDDSNGFRMVRMIFEWFSNGSNGSNAFRWGDERAPTNDEFS